MDFTSWDAGLHSNDPNSLEHYGVLGQKWGMRRYQNPDGSLTAAGKAHYEKTGEYGYHYKSHATKKYTRKAEKASKKAKAYALGAVLSGKNGNSSKASKMAKKSAALKAKSDKFKKRAERSAEIDKGEQEYAKSLSTGKALALTLLAGGAGTKGYAQYRAMAGQKGKNFTGQKAMAGVKAYRNGSLGSRVAKAAYIREGEKPNSIGQKAYRINKGFSNAGAQIVDTIAENVRRKRKNG